MKCFFGISDFLEEIFSLPHSIVFLYFSAMFTSEGLLTLVAILWNSAFRWVCLSFAFSQLFERSPQATIFPFCISFS